MLEGTHLELKENCPATLIPAGDEVILKAGMQFLITQALGGTVTLKDDTGLFRVNGQHLSKLGDEFTSAGSELLPDNSGKELTEDLIWESLKQCYDPEIPVNIVDLGLIYDLKILDDPDSDKKNIEVKMTLTAQGCGMGPSIAADAKSKIETLEAVSTAQVDIVWDPPWNPKMISEEGKTKLGLD